MTILILAACIGFMVAIRPAHNHDNEQPIQVTGKARK